MSLRANADVWLVLRKASIRPNLQPARGLPLNQLMRQTISGSAKTMQKMRGRAKIL
jgi:hypothetical protein